MTAKTDETTMETDLRSRVVALEQGQTALVPRVSALEQWQRTRDITDAGKDAEWRAMIERFNERFTSLEAQIKEVAGTLKWINKTIIGAVILAFVAFVISGGLTIP